MNLNLKPSCLLMLCQLTGGISKPHNNPILIPSTLTLSTYHMTGLQYPILEAKLIGHKSLLDIPLNPTWVNSKREFSSNLTHYILVFQPLFPQTKWNMYLKWTLLAKKWWLKVIWLEIFLNPPCAKLFSLLHKIASN